MTSNKLWIKTCINTSNVENVYLRVPRNTSHGTWGKSVSPIDYVDTWKHYYSIDLLNIPSICPTIDDQYLQNIHNFNTKQYEQVQDTVNLLWKIVRSITQKGQKQKS